MDPAIIVAIIAGGVSVASAALSVWTNRHTDAATRDTAERVAQLEEARQIRAEQRTKDQLAEQIQARYREPLLLSAFELQSRIWNMVEAGFRVPSRPVHDYLVEHTQYLIAQYLGWVEVMRREIQFLDLGAAERTHDLNVILDRITSAFATTRFPPPLRLFRGQQQAIAGEVISIESAPPSGERLVVIGFSEFARRLQAGEAAFVRWFTEIKSALEQWAIGDDTARPRLTVLQNSLEWESSYVELLAEHPASRAELRVRLQARELLHEHLAMYTALIREYGINLSREIGCNPGRPNMSRRRMVSFGDTIPSLRIAVDLKVELFRNPAKPWSMNAIHDIDALSMAIPYCHVVVPDREMASLLSRSGTGPRHGTKIITTLAALPDVLPELTEHARNAPGDQTGWDWAGPWDGYCLDWASLLKSVRDQPPTA
jgi:hypothetical protein